MKTSEFKEVFKCRKPIIGMLHLRGNGAEKVRIAREEAKIMYGEGVDAVLVEDYLNSTALDCEAVLRMLQEEMPDRLYGVNVLGDFTTSYALALEYGAAFMQVDSIAGHLPTGEERAYADEIALTRLKGDLCVLGGVRFKYQSVLSGRSLAEDLAIGRSLCEAIVVTGDGTGLETDMGKIREFRSILGDYPLVVGAGMTAANCAEQLAVADGGIVGSYFKVDGWAHNPMDPKRVREFMAEARKAGSAS